MNHCVNAGVIITNHQILFIEDGSLAVELDTQRLQLHSGDMLWLPPGTDRRYVHEEASRPIKHLRLRLQVLRSQRQVTWTQQLHYRQAAWNCLPIFQLVYHQCQRQGTYQQALSVKLLQALSLSFFELAPNLKKSFLSPQQKYAIDVFIREHLNCTPNDLATFMQLSHDYFTRQFKQAYEMTPQTYIKHMRMQLAAHDALQSALSNQALADKYCYGNASLFCRQFKQVHQCTLGQYRERMQLED